MEDWLNAILESSAKSAKNATDALTALCDIMTQASEEDFQENISWLKKNIENYWQRRHDLDSFILATFLMACKASGDAELAERVDKFEADMATEAARAHFLQTKKLPEA
ncbi:MAG: hypothetical protein UX81_C0024G0006 [Parcubacteria group bacterium GW2011_GWA2_47_12]|uniref:Uncharacterized protein n=1 Tax=Candidatus Giovannonibacteria bacterium RIFCSPLOWO2_01_FULL_44_16 TaxID=1798348 RepID=A0A1F5X4I7_9BACT|nr:MAG: hypothetical protein UX81_C0024G0006 [Parcubacteria group bacterium GW2011_GWA2_47_12]OGF82802.1 MAG: hypothetical protein A2924_03560 [Candidatus Giovannonibacteria bacterium RIFCSPLOWO2_01_FULL_44_16]